MTHPTANPTYKLNKATYEWALHHLHRLSCFHTPEAIQLSRTSYKLLKDLLTQLHANAPE